jgi:hypothetical protein
MGPHDVSLFLKRCRLYKEMRFPALHSRHLSGQMSETADSYGNRDGKNRTPTAKIPRLKIID